LLEISSISQKLRVALCFTQFW